MKRTFNQVLAGHLNLAEHARISNNHPWAWDLRNNSNSSLRSSSGPGPIHICFFFFFKCFLRHYHSTLRARGESLVVRTLWLTKLNSSPAQLRLRIPPPPPLLDMTLGIVDEDDHLAKQFLIMAVIYSLETPHWLTGDELLHWGLVQSRKQLLLGV